ncbi:unnamed protein product [Paramecium octaurelia]|uniref:H-type lectin domain-containing protein n=1 Tax=Paramecium octaurelia TaxID=43137 RepID=A0A8S1YMV2_PAROT|nr:unnamed protein product [Paramecium octaurelia]
MYQYQYEIPNQQTEYQFSITSITNTNFQFFVKCTKAAQVWSLRYEWVAIDDKRVQVINCFNMNPPQDKVFNHQLLNVDTAIIGLKSIAYISQIDFQLSYYLDNSKQHFGCNHQSDWQVPKFGTNWLPNPLSCCNEFRIKQVVNFTNLRNSIQLCRSINFKNVEKHCSFNSYVQFYKVKDQILIQGNLRVLFLEFKVSCCHNCLQQIKHFNAKHQEQVKSQIIHNATGHNLKSKYFNQIQYMMQLDNLQLFSLNQQQILISFCQQIVQLESMLYLNLINAMHVQHKNIINLTTIVTHKLIQQIIFLSSPNQIRLIKSSPQQQRVQAAKLSRYFIIKQKQNTLLQISKYNEPVNSKIVNIGIGDKFAIFPGKIVPISYNDTIMDFVSCAIELIKFDKACICQNNPKSNLLNQDYVYLNTSIYTSKLKNCNYFTFTGWFKIKEIIQNDKEMTLYVIIELLLICINFQLNSQRSKISSQNAKNLMFQNSELNFTNQNSITKRCQFKYPIELSLMLYPNIKVVILYILLMIQEINTTKSEKLQTNFELKNLLKEKQNETSDEAYYIRNQMKINQTTLLKTRVSNYFCTLCQHEDTIVDQVWKSCEQLLKIDNLEVHLFL